MYLATAQLLLPTHLSPFPGNRFLVPGDLPMLQIPAKVLKFGGGASQVAASPHSKIIYPLGLGLV